MIRAWRSPWLTPRECWAKPASRACLDALLALRNRRSSAIRAPLRRRLTAIARGDTHLRRDGSVHVLTWIAKRRLTETWRDAVSARAGTAVRHAEALQDFDRLCANGLGEAEAAFRALARLDLLWRVDLPGDRQAGPGPALRPAPPEDEMPVV